MMRYLINGAVSVPYSVILTYSKAPPAIRFARCIQEEYCFISNSLDAGIAFAYSSVKRFALSKLVVNTVCSRLHIRFLHAFSCVFVMFATSKLDKF